MVQLWGLADDERFQEKYSMRLFLRLNLFYGILAALIWGGYQLVPDLHRYLPLGVVEKIGRAHV